MARLAKCKGCSKELKIDERFVYSNKTYCDKCYNIKINEKKDYDNLILWICNYFNQNVPNGLMLKQIKEYKEKYEYTYSGIHYCLWYLTEIKCMRLEIKYGIGIVKLEYENAKKYFLQQQSIQQSVQYIKPIEVVRTVKLKTNKNSDLRFLIDIDKLVSKGD